MVNIFFGKILSDQGLKSRGHLDDVDCCIELMWGYHPPGELVGFWCIMAYVCLPLLLSVYLLILKR